MVFSKQNGRKIDLSPISRESSDGRFKYVLNGTRKINLSPFPPSPFPPLVFDEATSNLDQPTSEAFAKTINKLKGKVTILFITHQLPKGLKVDDAVILGKQQEQKMQDDLKDEGA